jgi:hypothetical protein
MKLAAIKNELTKRYCIADADLPPLPGVIVAA